MKGEQYDILIITYRCLLDWFSWGRSFTKNFVKKIKGAHLKYYSSSIKFCKLAEGKADFYPRFQSISKWDIAAGDAILRASGGYMLDKRGLNYNYNSLKVETGTFFAIASRILWSRVKKLI